MAVPYYYNCSEQGKCLRLLVPVFSVTLCVCAWLVIDQVVLAFQTPPELLLKFNGF